MRKLSRFLKPYLPQTIIAALLKLLEATMELQLISYMGQLIDNGIEKANMDYVWQMAFNMIMVSAVGLVAVLICHYMASNISTSIANDIQNSMIEQISSFSYREHDSLGTATLTNRLTSDVNMIKDTVSLTIRLVTRAPFLCIGAIIKSFGIDPTLALVFLIFVPSFAFILMIIVRKTAPLFIVVQQKLDELSIVLRENLSGIRVIRALARQDREKIRVEAATSELAESYITITKISTWLNPITLFMLNAGVFVIMYFGGFRVNAGSLMQGELYALTDYIVMTAGAMLIVSNLISFFTKSMASAERINEVFDKSPSVTYPNESAQVFSAESDDMAVEFKNVSFGYSKESGKVLDDISFKIPKGSVFGIVGTTGAGKSTIAHLISRSYDVVSGEVLLDGKNIKKYTKKDVNKLVAVVPQKALLFSGTIADNMRYGKPDASEDEINEALRIAQAGDFIRSMRNGIKTSVRQGGQNYSGGQRQRLTIARAIVKDSPILLLDDSLSALDYQTDMLLRASLRKDRPNQTLILISQRISSIMAANQILTLDKGRVAGIGTHEELLESCEPYRELLFSQTKKGEEGGHAS